MSILQKTLIPFITLAISNVAIAQNNNNRTVNHKFNANIPEQIHLSNQNTKSNSNKSVVTKGSMYPDLSPTQLENLKEFEVTPGGLFYKYITKGKSNKIAKATDIATIHVEYMLGDSLIFTTKNINAGGEPVTEVLKLPQYRGDVNEGLLMMSPGDKMEFKYSIDSLVAQTKAQMPPFVKSGDFATWTITMHDLMTKEEHDRSQLNQKNEQAVKDDAIILKHLKENKLSYVKSPSGVYIVFQEEGFDDSPVKGNKVTVNYTGKLMNGKVFDSNTDPKFNHVQPFTFTLLAGQVIKGWDEGVSMMRRKSKATLYIPSTLAYGSRSQGPDIPANSILVFDIEVLDY